MEALAGRHGPLIREEERDVSEMGIAADFVVWVVSCSLVKLGAIGVFDQRGGDVHGFDELQAKEVNHRVAKVVFQLPALEAVFTVGILFPKDQRVPTRLHLEFHASHSPALRYRIGFFFDIPPIQTDRQDAALHIQSDGFFGRGIPEEAVVFDGGNLVRAASKADDAEPKKQQ